MKHRNRGSVPSEWVSYCRRGEEYLVNGGGAHVTRGDKMQRH